jgi:hypothetical protein
VVLELEHDGMRATRVAVLRVEPSGDVWGVETTLGRDWWTRRASGHARAARCGVGEKLAERGTTSCVFRSTLHEIEQDLDRSLDGLRLERDLGRDDTDRNNDRDYGPER